MSNTRSQLGLWPAHTNCMYAFTPLICVLLQWKRCVPAQKHFAVHKSQLQPRVYTCIYFSRKKARYSTGWATQELLLLVHVERRVWRVVVLWWHATAHWKARQMGCFCFFTACLQIERVKSCRRRCLYGAQKRVKSGAPYEPAEQKCESGVAIQPVNPHTKELRTRCSGLWCARIEFGCVLLTMSHPPQRWLHRNVDPYSIWAHHRSIRSRLLSPNPAPDRCQFERCSHFLVVQITEY